MTQPIPDIIQPILNAYTTLLADRLPGLIQAFYLEGSLALGGFNEHFSDIDFIAQLQREITPEEIKTLREIHSGIEKNWPCWKLSGSYLPDDYFDDWKNAPGPILNYHDGVLRSNGQFKLNSVEGWLLKNHGISVLGPPPQTLVFEIDWDLLIQDMRANLNSYWLAWATKPGRIAMLLSDWGIQWAVLGVLRQYYSFREHSIITKTAAGEYALEHVPTRWHPLIHEAINIRAGRPASAYRSRLLRTIETVRFLKFIIQTCNASFT